MRTDLSRLGFSGFVFCANLSVASALSLYGAFAAKNFAVRLGLELGCFSSCYLLGTLLLFAESMPILGARRGRNFLRMDAWSLAVGIALIVHAFLFLGLLHIFSTMAVAMLFSWKTLVLIIWTLRSLFDFVSAVRHGVVDVPMSNSDAVSHLRLQFLALLAVSLLNFSYLPYFELR